MTWLQPTCYAQSVDHVAKRNTMLYLTYTSKSAHGRLVQHTRCKDFRNRDRRTFPERRREHTPENESIWDLRTNLFINWQAIQNGNNPLTFTGDQSWNRLTPAANRNAEARAEEDAAG